MRCLERTAFNALQEIGGECGDLFVHTLARNNDDLFLDIMYYHRIHRELRRSTLYNLVRGVLNHFWGEFDPVDTGRLAHTSHLLHTQVKGRFADNPEMNSSTSQIRFSPISLYKWTGRIFIAISQRVYKSHDVAPLDQLVVSWGCEQFLKTCL